MVIFLIFQDGGFRRLGFLKFQIFYDRNGQESRTVSTSSTSQFSSKSLKPRPIYVSFNIMLLYLKMPIHAAFWWFWGTFLPNDVTHRSNPKKDRPWAEPRRLSHKARISVARFELGV